MKNLDPHEEHGPDEISYVLKESEKNLTDHTNCGSETQWTRDP